MSCVATEQIAAGLRRRGFDGRTFADGDKPGGLGHRGVAVHGICVSGWRYPNGRWEFTNRPPRLIAPDEHNPSGRWIWDDILTGCCQPAAAVSDQVQVVVGRVAELLAADPNHHRSQCIADFWAWDAMCRDSAEAPDRWYREWCDHLFTELRPEAARAGYTPDTARLADHMCSPRAVVQRVDTAVSGSQVYRLAPGVPLAPALLDRALGVHLRTDFCTWAQIGHTSDPVDCLPSSPRWVDTWAGTTNGSTVITGPIPAPHFNASNPNRVSKSPAAWDQTGAYWFPRTLSRYQRPITDGEQNSD